MLYNVGNEVEVPSVDLLTLLFDSEHCRAEEHTPLHAEAGDPEAARTKSEIRVIAQQIAHWLREQYGIGKNDPAKDVVVTCSNGQVALPCFFYGVVAAEGIYSAASTLASPNDLAKQVTDGSAKVLACSEDMRGVATAAAESAGLPRRNVLILESSPQICITSADGSAVWSYSPEQHQPQLPWRAMTAAEELQKTTVCLVYSSGTTGVAKGVRISHSNMVSEAFLPASMNRPIWDRWDEEGRPFESRTLAHLGCSHISGVQGYFVNPFFDGGIVYWMPQFDLMEFLGYNVALKITTFFSLPRVYAAAAHHPAVTTQLSSLRIAYSGGYPLDPRVYDSHKLGGQGELRTLLSQTWGATETTGAATHMPPDRRDKTGSVGVLLPNMLMRLADEHGNSVPPGQPGEAWLKGPIIAQGYQNNPKADQVAFEDGWYRTGDMVELRGDLVYVLGRVKEMIKYRDQHVPPAELESILIQYSGVADAAVVGVVAEDTDVPRALVALRPGVEGDSDLAQKIAAYVDEKVHDSKRLRGGVVFVPEIPRLVVGKICRDKLPQLVR